MTARRNHRDLTELTSREREVLDLLGLALTNEQIAERLGISLDGAKYHVSQILSKLGVSRREEAVRATGQKSRWARLRVPLGVRIIGGALLVLALGGAGVLAAMVALDGDDGPIVGDHWHAPYQVYIGDERQEVFLSLDSGMTTLSDGIIHIEPRTPDEERENASLSRFFEDAGGELTDTSLRLPGSDATYRNGDDVPGIGAPGSVFALKRKLGEGGCVPELAAPHDFITADYVPQDGDRITIMFTTEAALQLEAQATCSPPNPAGPVVGDHWHAPYAIYIGDDRQEVFSSLYSGMKAQNDGIIHVVPRTPDEERENASLARFFEDAGGELTTTSLSVPGSGTTYRDGDNVPGIGSPGRLFILKKEYRNSCWDGLEVAGPHDFVTAEYVPQDGDSIIIVFMTDETYQQKAQETCSPANHAP